jgi:hypothetical protein
MLPPANETGKVKSKSIRQSLTSICPGLCILDMHAAFYVTSAAKLVCASKPISVRFLSLSPSNTIRGGLRIDSCQVTQYAPPWL